MTTPQLIARLKLLVGHSFAYQGGTVKIVNWQIDGDQLLIKTHSKLSDIKMHIAHVKEFLLELEPLNGRAKDALDGIEPSQAEQTAVVAPAGNAVAQMVPTATLSTINDALLDSIRKVQLDSAYIPQAKAISDTVQVVVNVAKLQMEGAKLLLQAQRAGK